MKVMKQMLRASTPWAWALLAIAIPLSGFLSIYVGLILISGWGKILGVIVLGFFFLSIEAALGFGAIFIDDDAIVSSCLLGRFRICWNEVEKMWSDGSQLNLVLEGHGKRVAIAGYSLWKSPDKAQMVEIMTRKLTERGIEPRMSNLKTLQISNRAAKINE